MSNFDRDRLNRLQALTAALCEAITPAQVVDAVVAQGVDALGAHAGLVALITDDGADLELVRTRGYAERNVEPWRRFPLTAHLPLSDVVRDGAPLFIETFSEWRSLYPEMVAHTAETLRAAAGIPLISEGRAFGGIYFSFPNERVFSPEDREFIGSLARQCGLALERARLYDEAQQRRDRAEAAERRLAFLARASGILGASLDYGETLEALVGVAVPVLADWAAVDVVTPDGLQLERRAVAHVDPKKVEWAHEVQRKYPPDMTSPTGVAGVIRTGRTAFVPEVTDEMLVAGISNPEQLADMRAMDIASVIIAPLSAGGQTLGALTLVTTGESGRRFDRDDFEFAEELARRAGVAVENARLYRDSRESGDALARREREYAAIAENSDDVIARFDSDLRFLYANRAIERNIGVPAMAVIGKTLPDLGFPEENLAQWRQAIGKVFATGEREMIRFSYPSPVLGQRWYEASICPETMRPLMENEEPATGSGLDTVIVVAHDITDRHMAEEERERLLMQLQLANAEQGETLRATEESFRLFVGGVRDYAIFMLDVDGRVKSWNAGAQLLKGYTAEEIVGRHFSTFYTAQDIARRHPWEELEIAVREGRYEEEGWRVRKDGSRFWASVVITAMRDEHGTLRGFGKVTRDFTERRERELEQTTALIVAQQRRFLKDVLASVTQGKLILCDNHDEFPAPLAEESDAEAIPLNARSLKAVRSAVCATMERCGLIAERALDFVTAVSECAMNAVQHAGGGTARIYGSPASGLVQVFIGDGGRGIDLTSLPRATLERGYSTGGSGFGHGFWLMLQTCDRVYLLTGAAGTTIVLEQNRSAAEPGWLK